MNIDLTTIYGQISVPDWPDDLIVKTLQMHGEWAYSEQILISSLIRKGDVLWDVGAFLGTFGIGVSQLAQAKLAKLVAVEPSEILRPHLYSNLIQNASCPFELIPCGVSLLAERLKPRNDKALENAGALSYEPADGKEASVEARTLRSLRADFGDYDVLKLDIEGMEDEAIRSDLEYLQRRRPVIWAECNEDISSIRLLEALRWLDYETVYVAFPAFRKKNFNSSDRLVFPLAYEAVLLAAPEERLASFVEDVPFEDIIVYPVRTSFDLRCALWKTPRWSMPEWIGLSKPELISMLGRNQRNESLLTFLNDTILKE